MRQIIKSLFSVFGYKLMSVDAYNKIIKSKKSYSQIGEDIIVNHIFSLKGLLRPSYLDIGAHDPKVINNTFLFYQKGARGVNIDANPSCIEKFLKERPDDINLNIAIGKEEGQFQFYIMEDKGLSTFSQTEYKKYVDVGYKLDEIITVQMISVNKVIEKYCNNSMPDFLSLDTEGLDFEIIQQINFDNNRPRVICIETAGHSNNGVGEKRVDIIEFIAAHEYFEYANTSLNSIFVDKRWFYS